MKFPYINVPVYSTAPTWNQEKAHINKSYDTGQMSIELYHGYWIATYYDINFSSVGPISAYIIDHPDGTHWAHRDTCIDTLKQYIDTDLLFEQAYKEHHIEADI